ncbi:MAG: exodeoxyribonuclease VII large subunit [Gammaproteobacteria bacterium]|nr:exodeoxyribonuclease VII large subunit [Gammaproteobacteria bacterium]
MSDSVYTVKRLNREIRHLLEENYRTVWVDGEISGLAAPPSGHLYFSLKEGNSVIRCAYFRNRQVHRNLVPAEGMQVLARGQISCYEPRGDLQLIVYHLEESGEGILQRAFERLKQKLAAEGLFDPQNKQPVPQYPGTVGIVTSESGAALHDIVVTLNRRYPVARVIVYPTLVQGTDAPASIIRAIDQAELHNQADVLIIARGGGSLEDLQAFNHEDVCRRIFACPIMTISAIGHEIDFTICDFVSDQRAPTPTAAAELATPDLRQVHQALHDSKSRIRRCMATAMRDTQQVLDLTTARLTHPESKIAAYHARFHTYQKYLNYNMQGVMDGFQNKLGKCSALVRTHSPWFYLRLRAQQLQSNSHSLLSCARNYLQNQQRTIRQKRDIIQLMSPDHTLQRGYAIVQDEKKQVVTDADDTQSGDILDIRVARGRFTAVVNR